MLKNSLFARRLKKVQVQGAARSEVRGVLSRVPIPMGGRNTGGTRPKDGSAFFSSLLALR